MGMIPDYEKTVLQQKDRLVKELGARIDSIILYGSVARKEAREESDIDLLIVTPDKSIRREVVSISYEVDLENGTFTSHVYVTPQEFEKYVEWGDPFLKEVLRQGMVLYDNGTYSAIRRRLLKAGG